MEFESSPARPVGAEISAPTQPVARANTLMPLHDEIIVETTPRPVSQNGDDNLTNVSNDIEYVTSDDTAQTIDTAARRTHGIALAVSVSASLLVGSLLVVAYLVVA